VNYLGGEGVVVVVVVVGVAVFFFIFLLILKFRTLQSVSREEKRFSLTQFSNTKLQKSCNHR
jgi:hypothetical protein